MALTFTKRSVINMDIAGKQFRMYEMTHDGSTATANATDFGLHYIEHAMAGPGTQVLTAASTAYCDLTTSYGSALAFTALSAGATTNLWLVGW
jgi:hypothetical protein